jgi:hypothetical protein
VSACRSVLIQRVALEFIGNCALCAIFVTSTPLAARLPKYDKEKFCSPYRNMRGHGNERNFDIKSPWSDR